MKWSVVVVSFALIAIGTFAITKDNKEKTKFKDAFDKEVTIQDIDQPSDTNLKNHHGAMKRMMKIFNNMKMPDMDMSFSRGGMPSMTGGNIEILTKSDNEFEYIEIIGDDLDPKALNINIKDGMVSVSGTIEKRVDNNNNGYKSTSSYVSSFSRSFNVPRGVDESKVSFEPNKNKLIIKFQKV